MFECECSKGVTTPVASGCGRVVDSMDLWLKHWQQGFQFLQFVCLLANFFAKKTAPLICLLRLWLNRNFFQLLQKQSTTYSSTVKSAVFRLSTSHVTVMDSYGLILTSTPHNAVKRQFPSTKISFRLLCSDSASFCASLACQTVTWFTRNSKAFNPRSSRMLSILSKSHSDKKQVIQAHLLLQKINMTLESVGLLKQQGDDCDRVAKSQLGILNMTLQTS